MKKILLGLTTTSRSDWKEKVNEIEKYNIREIALFPTFLEINKRKELYSLLDKTNLESIPHVHLRGDDMSEEELDYFVNKFHTKLFNVHAEKRGLDIFRFEKYRKMIFLENQHEINKQYIDNIDKCGGICLDVTHWEDQGERLGQKGYDKLAELCKKYPVGCCHISAISECKDLKKEKGIPHYSRHYMEDLSQLDYVKKYLKYMPNIVSIELENSFAEQLKARDYLNKIINV